MANKQTAHLLPPRHKVQEIGWVALPFEQSARDVVLPGQEKTWWLGRPWAEQGAGWLGRSRVARGLAAPTCNVWTGGHRLTCTSHALLAEENNRKESYNFYSALSPTPEQKLLTQQKKAALILFISQNDVEWKRS